MWSGRRLPYGLGWYVQGYLGHTLVWHSGWWEQEYSALYLKVLGNPLDKAEVEKSAFAQLFLRAFLDAEPLIGEDRAHTVRFLSALSIRHELPEAAIG
jgi:hypothetical protein